MKSESSRMTGSHMHVTVESSPHCDRLIPDCTASNEMLAIRLWRSPAQPGQQGPEKLLGAHHRQVSVERRARNGKRFADFIHAVVDARQQCAAFEMKTSC